MDAADSPPGFAPFRLVPFEKRHETELIALIASCYGQYRQVIELDTLDADLLRVAEAYAPPEHVFRVLLDDARLVGSVAVRRKAGNEAELKRVFLEPACRGRGLGKRLVLWAFAWAREHGCAVVHIWSDVLYRTSHHLYRGLGAEDTGERRLLGGRNLCEEFHFRMRL